MPSLGTPSTGTPSSLTYGSFGNTKPKAITIMVNKNDDVDDPTDIDSGMSSEENEDSLNLSSNNVSKNIIYKDNVSNHSVDKQEVITKCLIIEPREIRNVIPCCSNDANSVNANENRTLSTTEVVAVKNVSEYIVIDLTCDVDSKSDLSRSEDVTDCRIDCDSSEPSVETSLVPVGNNEIARRENQKLLSLSLSILLAALLQAMRCFAQFLEDIIVIPHR